MNTKTIKYLTTGVLLLAAVNIALLVLVFTGKENPQHPPHPRPEIFLQQELNLSAQQMQAYHKLRDTHRAEAGRLQEKLHTLRRSLFALYGNSTDTTQTPEAITASIGSTQAELELLTYEHFEQVRALCTPEQQKKFDAVIGEVMEHMARRPPPRKP